jgi:eukaryotic-like serine/threonine-protein kinase
MTTAQYLGTPLPVGATVIPGTLRAAIEELRAQGTTLNLQQAVAIIVPLCVEVAERHRSNELLYLHPSSVIVEANGHCRVSPDLAARPPTLPRDKACMAPEERQGRPGNARASVFAVGAMLYELVTGLPVGPGMRRPTEVQPSLPPEIELLLSKSLVADPRHRPDDLNALAQAIHNLAPAGHSIPPAADVSHLDHDTGFEVDVRLSMLPPHELVAAASPYDVAVRQQPAAPQSDSTSELAMLKARLESDPRPRYVVIKDGMDHGPFSAVELLQQIASHSFVESDILRDAFSKDERQIKDWEEFAPFAEHARLNRDIKAEKAALERVVVQESRSTRGKAFIGIALVGALIAAAAVWFLTVRGQKSDDITVQGETATNIEVDSGLNVAKSKRKGGGRVMGNSGGIPILAGGGSCESAQAAYIEEMSVSGPRGQADLTQGQYASVLNRGTYFGHCGVPDSMSVNICAAVQNGRAVGVTVTTNPRNGRVSSCVASAVRGLSFPSHPKLDVARTTFAAQ